MGVPAAPAADDPAGAAPAHVRAATTPRTGVRPSSELGAALHEERVRLQARRAALELEIEEIESQIATIDGRIGDVEALLAGELVAGPPVELPSIGSRPDAAAA